MAYAELILNGDSETYWKTVTEYKIYRIASLVNQFVFFPNQWAGKPCILGKDSRPKMVAQH
ncbi:MAG: DUF6061 family protein [Bacillus sp. (in: firmicutes)]